MIIVEQAAPNNEVIAALKVRVSELEQTVSDELARITQLRKQLSSVNRELASNEISMIQAISRKVIKATHKLMELNVIGESQVMDVITNGQKRLAATRTHKLADIHSKLAVCLATADMDVTAEELSSIKDYMAALQAGDLTHVKAWYNHVGGLFFREMKQAADSGHSDTDWDDLVKSADMDTYLLLLVKTHYF